MPRLWARRLPRVRAGLLARAWTLALALILLGGAARSAAPLAQMHERRSPHFVFYYNKEKATDVETVQLSAEAAFRRIAENLDFQPKNRIPVVIYANRDEFRKNAQVSRTELVVGTASSADDAIRLDGSKVWESPDRVVGHEVAHIFLFQLLGPDVTNMPLWLNEGLAEELGGADPRRAHSFVVEALYDDRVRPLSSLAQEFPAAEQAGLAYNEAQDAVGTLLERGGWAKMRELLSYLRSGATFDTALRETYGFSAAEWDGIWLNSLKARARRTAWIQVASWLIPVLMLIALAWGVLTVRRHRLRQIADEEPVSDLEPPTWWREDEFRM